MACLVWSGLMLNASTTLGQGSSFRSVLVCRLLVLSSKVAGSFRKSGMRYCAKPLSGSSARLSLS